MKQHAKWMAATVVAVVGLAVVNSAQAQAVTGDPTLDNIAPGGPTYYPGWNAAPTVITSGPSGLEIASTGYGSLYYPLPAGQVQTLNPADSLATLTFTLNNPAGSYYVGVPFILDDSNGGSVTYGGYATYGKGTWSETVSLTPAQQTSIAGGAKITGLNLEFDPAGNVPGGAYDITFNSVVLSVPEPSTVALFGLGAVALVVFRRRAK